MAENAKQRRALAAVRTIWAVAAGSQVLLLLGAIIYLGQPIATTTSPLHPGLFYLSAVALLAAVMIGYFARTQLYKRYWREHVIAPSGYVTGNAVLLGLLAAASTLALVSAVAVKVLLPYLLVSGAALAIMLVNVPRGRPLLRHEPRLGDESPQE